MNAAAPYTTLERFLDHWDGVRMVTLKLLHCFGEADLRRGRGEASRANDTAQANGAQQDMAWNSAPIYLPVTGATLLVGPPMAGNLREAWHQIVWSKPGS